MFVPFPPPPGKGFWEPCDAGARLGCDLRYFCWMRSPTFCVFAKLQARFQCTKIRTSCFGFAVQFPCMPRKHSADKTQNIIGRCRSKVVVSRNRRKDSKFSTACTLLLLLLPVVAKLDASQCKIMCLGELRWAVSCAVSSTHLLSGIIEFKNFYPMRSRNGFTFR